MEIEAEHIGQRIIIEGPECVGKDTFIEKFLEFLKSGEMYEGKPDFSTKVKVETRRRKAFGSKGWGKGLNGRRLKKYYKALSERTDPGSWSDVLSFSVISPKDGCDESGQFIKNIHEGKLTKEEMFTEWLQVHWDYELLARDLETIKDIVIMNRGLLTYEANQLAVDGAEHKRANYNELVTRSYQEDAILIVLKAPIETIRERYKARKANDFRGEIEDHYISNLEKSIAVYDNVNADGYASVIEFDTTQPDEKYQELFRRLVQVIFAQKKDSETDVSKLLEEENSVATESENYWPDL